MSEKGPTDRGDVVNGAGGAGEAASRDGPLRRLYHWVLGWADRPGGPAALFGIAVVESSVFPIPPDALLIPLALGRPRRAWRFAALCTVGLSHAIDSALRFANLRDQSVLGQLDEARGVSGR